MTDKILEGFAIGLGMATWGIPLLIIVYVVAGKYLNGYLTEKGKNLASKEDFSQLRDQLKTTTKDTEEIKQLLTSKGWLAQQMWAKREQRYETLMRRFMSLKRQTASMLRTEEENLSENKEQWSKFEQVLYEMTEELDIAQIFITDKEFLEEVVQMTHVSPVKISERDMIFHIYSTCETMSDILIKIARRDLKKIDSAIAIEKENVS